jgi:predicted CXXCH cytochrome family protein
MSRFTKQAAVRVGGILGGAGVLFVGGVLVASAPAFADNGPHVGNQGSTAVSTVDGCAGCHRLHSAQSGDGMLLAASSETALCSTCHTAGAGATTDVINGVAYDAKIGGNKTANGLRGGGFTNALLGTATRTVTAGAIDKANLTIAAGAGGQTTSRHAMGVNSGTQWGAGGINAAAKTVSLQCGSCHDPHGNGNYRILRPYGALGAQTIASAAPTVTGITDVADTVNAGKRVWTISFDLAAAGKNPFLPGQPVAVVGTNVTGFSPAYTFNASRNSWSWTQYNISAVDAASETSQVAHTISIPNMAALPTPVVAGGKLFQAWPNTIKGAVVASPDVTYTTFIDHGLQVGQKVTIKGADTFNVTRAVITAVPSTTTFTVTNSAATGTIALGGYIEGIPDIPDAANKIYTTTNYWRADDHNYVGTGGTAVPLTTDGQSAFIANTSQWCTTCHTRYLAASSTSRKFSSGDTVFTFRHTSGAYKESSPSCMQCHVAHGSNAVMNGTYTSTLKDPGAATGTNDSRLLRVDNRGVCLFCHDM